MFMGNTDLNNPTDPFHNLAGTMCPNLNTHYKLKAHIENALNAPDSHSTKPYCGGTSLEGQGSWLNNPPPIHTSPIK